MRLQKVRIGYQQKIVLSVPDYQFETSRLHVLYGANASGKTSLLRCLAGEQSFIEGTLSVQGRPVAPDSRAWRSGRAWVPAHPALFDELAPADQLLFKAELCEIQRPKEEVAGLVSRFKLEQVVQTPAGQLSSGFRARIALALALVDSPSFIFLDEPLNFLDVEGAACLLDALDTATGSGATVLVASHYIDPFVKAGARIHCLVDGSIRES